MMLLSAREQALLREFLTSSAPVSINRMMSLLKVSRRTVYRELAQLDVTLQQLDTRLIKVARGSFALENIDEHRQQLIQLVNEEKQEFSSVERQHAILLEIALTKTPLSAHHFLEKYLISHTTFYADIKQLEEQLSLLPLAIERNQGYEMIGSEKYRRLLIADVLKMEINEYQFFHFIEKTDLHYFFQFLTHEHVIFAKQIAQPELAKLLPELSDRKLQHLIVMLTLAMDRVTNHCMLEDEIYTGAIQKEFLDCAKRLFSKVGLYTEQLYRVNEIVFFASLLSDFANSFDQDFFEERFDTKLAYSTKQLIEKISEETEVKFYEDERLYKMLLTHLSSVFSRAVLQHSTLTNPILEQIMETYSDIAHAIRKTLPTVFREKQLSEEEIAYMVIHFASSLERNPRVMAVDIAGFSPSGLASTSMLEMRLRRFFPFINTIVFYRISELDQLNLANQYDLVLSTSLLPGYQGKYTLVSPLLLEEDIQRLKDEFKQLSLKKKKIVKESKEIVEGNYEQVMTTMNEINELLQRFFIKKVSNPNSVVETLHSIQKEIPKGISTDQQKVAEKLIHRFQQSPVGIPGADMALFHTSCSEIIVPLFCVFDLTHTLEIEGMDRQPMALKRILLMLAPSPIPETTTKILGKISGAIIMNDLYTEIFRSGNQPIIYQLLATLLIEELKN